MLFITKGLVNLQANKKEAPPPRAREKKTRPPLAAGKIIVKNERSFLL
jgi:hypothetical protein